MLMIYYAPGSCAFAALIALEQAGLSYEAVRVDTAAGEQRSSAYLKINALGRVPAMTIDGQPITELLAILCYIAAVSPNSNVLPLDRALELGKTMELLSWFSSNLHIHVAQALRGERFSDDPSVIAALKEPGRKRLQAAFSYLDSKIAGSGEYLVGDAFTAADAVALVAWRWAMKLEFNSAAWPNLAAKAKADLIRPHVSRAVAVESQTENILTAEVVV